ncbi:MAG: YitT family protein [Butyrivibrio sp.]|uniref:YitT family protein n=1 Tax=Butyrivibrio sp. TaxID=28121 RepID=UPI0025F37F68|nr:YitT family protein [Butyrivibrio sp.]MCR5772953.1 YitT family protein [Butyrivibrio sp.]
MTKIFGKRYYDLVSLLFIILGALMASFSVACILLPNDTLDYGTAGLGIIISRLSGINLSVCVFAVFLPFIISGIFFLGKTFTVKALIGSVTYTVGLELFENIPFVLNTEHFIAVAFGGAILGAGLSLILRFGGCIDGSEILANIIVDKYSEKTGRNISMTSILVTFNILVYTAAFFLLNQNSALLGLLVYIVATSITDHFTDRFEAIKRVTIITKNPDGLINKIKNDMKKTCTVMDSYGAIAGKNKTVICYVTYFELRRLRDIIDSFEEKAFITVSSIDEIHIKK